MNSVSGNTSYLEVRDGRNFKELGLDCVDIGAICFFAS